MSRITNEDEARWTKSLKCSSGACVEVCRSETGSRIRDNKQNGLGSSQPIISLSVEEWDQFTSRVLKSEVGDFTVPKVRHHWDGAVTLAQGDTFLDFDADEWTAFISGLADGDFD